MSNKKHKWFRIDNAGKVYPAAKYKNWHSFFRVSASLVDNVDVKILQDSLDATVKRFPSMSVRLKRGMFWYYLEELNEAPKVQEDVNCPLKREPFDNVRKCAIRVLYYKNRVAVEFFHAVTDGNGALIFLKTLISVYLSKKYGVVIPCEKGVYDITEKPQDCEFVDEFVKYASSVGYAHESHKSFHIKGTRYEDYFLSLTTGIIDVQELKTLAKKYNCTITTLLAAVVIESVINIQKQMVQNPKRHKRVNLLIPVNLRNLFESKSLRNFALYVLPGINPRLGDYSLEEIIKLVDAQIKLELDPKRMAGRMYSNVAFEKNPILKFVPLGIKNFTIKLIYSFVGENTSCFTLSNLGNVEVPDEMKKYITRFDCILGTQAYLNNNIGVISYDGKLYLNFIRNIEESILEETVLTRLVKLGLHVKVESNQR